MAPIISPLSRRPALPAGGIPMRTLTFAILVGFLAQAAAAADETSRPVKILFLGDNAGHKPETRFRLIEPVLARHGITLTYTDKVEALAPQVLAGYDGLLIYANHLKITPEQEKALLDFVEGGKGFI